MDVCETDACVHELQVNRALLLRYRAAMASVVRSMGVQGVLVEDVVHDAFEMACRKPDAERPDPTDQARYLGWLCALAKFAALSARNDIARSREISSPAEALDEAPQSHWAYVGSVDDKVAASTVFAGLNADDQALLRQHFYEDKTIQELAAERGVPWSTMRSRMDGVLDRARVIVRDRRRGWGVVALLWLGVSIRQMRRRADDVFGRAAQIISGRSIASAGVGAVVGAVVMALMLPKASTAPMTNELATIVAERVSSSQIAAGGQQHPLCDSQVPDVQVSPKPAIVHENAHGNAPEKKPAAITTTTRRRSSLEWNVDNFIRDNGGRRRSD